MYNYKLTYTYRIVFIHKPCPNIPIFFFQPFAFIILFFQHFLSICMILRLWMGPVSGTPVPWEPFPVESGNP